MKVLITGAAGKIGQKLISSLIGQKLFIRALLRRNNFVLSDKVEVFFGDLLDTDSLSRAVSGIDTIVHLAAITHTNNQKLYWLINTQGTKNLIRAAEKAEINRFIFMSTRAIDSRGGAYSQSKLAAEEIVRNSKINWIILRPAEVYGIEQGEMIDRLIKFTRKSFLVPVIKSKQICLAPLYISDLIKAIEKVIFRKNLAGKTYVLAGPDNFYFKELIESICLFYQIKRIKISLPLFLFKILTLIPVQSLLVHDQITRLIIPKSFDISLAEKDLDFKPISFQEGLALLNR